MGGNTSSKTATIVLEGDIHALTPKGREELSSAGTSRSKAELEVLVLIDGKSTAGTTVGRAQGLGIKREEALDAMAKLFEDGLIALAKMEGGGLDFVDFFSVEPNASAEKTKLAEANRAAAATAALLKERGYFVSIARRPGPQQPAAQAARVVLVVDDEPLVIKMLKHVLEGEGFDVRAATNKQETLEQIRRTPLPDLVMLDVMLPDVDGFQILDAIRRHPALKALPVVMLTSKATREAVLRGLTGDANGYITKPFEIPVLIKAVHAVLGMSEEHDVITSKDPWSV